MGENAHLKTDTRVSKRTFKTLARRKTVGGFFSVLPFPWFWGLPWLILILNRNFLGYFGVFSVFSKEFVGSAGKENPWYFEGFPR